MGTGAVVVASSRRGFEDRSTGEILSMIAAGRAVPWNVSGGGHAVTELANTALVDEDSDDRLRESSNECVFDAPGIFHYDCRAHGVDAMSGLIVVTA